MLEAGHFLLQPPETRQDRWGRERANHTNGLPTTVGCDAGCPRFCFQSDQACSRPTDVAGWQPQQAAAAVHGHAATATAAHWQPQSQPQRRPQPRAPWQPWAESREGECTVLQQASGCHHILQHAMLQHTSDPMCRWAVRLALRLPSCSALRSGQPATVRQQSPRHQCQTQLVLPAALCHQCRQQILASASNAASLAAVSCLRVAAA